MKALKKLSCVLLVVLLMLSLSTTAFAADPPTFSLTIKEDSAGHQYAAYQIFTGDLAEKDGKEVLSNIKWGKGITDEGKVALAKELGLTEEDAADAAKVAEKITEGTLQDMAKALVPDGVPADGQNLVTNAVSLTQNKDAGNYSVDGVPVGYYLIVDTANPDDVESFSVTDYIVQVVGDVDMAPKSGAPQIEKKVDDVNDSNNTENAENWQDSADYDIGDDVPFQVTVTLPSDYAKYDTYKITITDTMSPGLTFNNNVAISGLDVGEYTVSELDGVITITIDDLKSVGTFDNNGKLTITYSAKLNENAVIGAGGNPNTVKMDYSNNPNGEGTGHTPEDKVTVFTFKIDVNKVRKAAEGDDDADGDGFVPLEGAGFTLYKWNGTEYVQVGDELIAKEGETMTTFEFKGLDDGLYKIEETTTPPGFNTIDPLYFTVAATHDVDSATPSLTGLTVTQTDEKGETIKDATDTLKITFTVDPDTGTASTDILNQSGLELPETGGIGTTIFYTVGGVLVAVALILLVTKKRVRSEQ